MLISAEPTWYPKVRPTSNKAVKTWSVLENPQWQFDDVPPRQPRRILAALCSRSHISPCPCTLAGIFGHPGFNSQIEIENERRTAIYVRSDENENFQESRCGACVVLVGLLWATEALPLEVLLISPCWTLAQNRNNFHFILSLFYWCEDVLCLKVTALLPVLLLPLLGIMDTGAVSKVDTDCWMLTLMLIALTEWIIAKNKLERGH